MKEINEEILYDAAKRLMFQLSKQECETLLEEFKILTRQMDTIGKIKGLEEYEPMTFPFDVTVDYLREDEATTPLPREEALRNAGSTQDGEIKLPKVVG